MTLSSGCDQAAQNHATARPSMRTSTRAASPLGTRRRTGVAGRFRWGALGATGRASVVRARVVSLAVSGRAGKGTAAKGSR